MKKYAKKSAVFLLAVLMAFETVPMTASAAEEERVVAVKAEIEATMVTDASMEVPDVVTTEEIITGKAGPNGGISYSYNSATKTIIISGTETDFQGGFVDDAEEPISAFDEISTDVETIIVENCTLSGSANCMFANLKSLKTVRFNNVNTANVTDMGEMFYGCKSLESLDLSGFNTANVTRMDGMFAECTALESLNVSSFNTANVTDMFGMFEYCYALQSLDLSNFNTAKVTDMMFMFCDCESLTSLNISNFNTQNVTWMDYMFYGCTSLETLDISSFNTSKVESFSYMFTECKGLTALDVSNFDTANASDFACMFRNCTELLSLDVSGFQTHNAEDMSYMFYNLDALKELDICHFNTSKVTNMNAMFYNCQALEEIDVSSFDTAKVTNMRYMFGACTSLERLDLRSFDLSSLENSYNMLSNCAAINVLYTPKIIASGITISLPVTFYNAQGTGVSEITGDYANTMLMKTVPTATRTISLSAPKNVTAVTVDNSLQLTVSADGVALSTEEYKDFDWTVDNTDVITVSDSGLVTGVGMGTATVTCTYNFNEQETASYQFVVEIPFADITATDWQYPYVVYVYENNIMAGKDSNFDMNSGITRSEFVTVLYNYNKKPAVTYSQDFSDVTQADWFAKPITWAKQNNITAGYADGRFGVYDSITREQLVVMLYKYAKATGVVTEDVTVDLSDFADAADVTSWAQKALTWATQNNIITGKNANGVKNIAPQDSTTRGECATMIKKYIALTEE